MNNMNSGFICIKDRKIDFVNIPMLNKMKGDKKISKIFGKYEILNDISQDKKEDNILLGIPGDKIEKTNEEMLSIIREDEQICTKILDAIFVDINSEINEKKIFKNDLKKSSRNLNEEIYRQRNNSDNYNSHTNIINQFSSQEFLKKFQINYEAKNQNENFTFVGYKDLEVETEFNGVMATEVINMEITGRFCKISEYNNSDTFEFIFNDITRTKNIEEINAEFKYKTLFLSKVAHEFKNPIICIIELVNQIYDDLQINDEENKHMLSSPRSTRILSMKKTLHNSLPIIKALSNYLLILVKDLDFFSQSQIGGTENKLEILETNLQEILEFCSEISNGLLKKNSKQSQVSFVIKKAEDLPENIYTDEIKLKQILINLISNAIKFTNHGKVELGVEIQKEGMLRFQIEDTGPGLTEEQKSNLFKPFHKSNSKNNKIGAGLGLTIVSDLISQFRGSLSFESKLGEGTKFCFDINYKSCLNDPNESENNFISNRLEKKKSLLHKTEITEIEIPHIIINLKKNSSKSITESVNSSSSQKTIKMKMVLSHPIMRQKPEASNLNENCMENTFIKPRQVQSLKIISDLNNSKGYFEEIDTTALNYIVVDDEKFTRKAVIRVLKKAAFNLKKKVNLIESEDGIETLFIIYQSVMKGVNITGVISDETMNFMTGSKSAQILKSLNMHAIKKIPFFLTTAYENCSAIEKLDFVDAIYQKPIKVKDAEKILLS